MNTELTYEDILKPTRQPSPFREEKGLRSELILPHSPGWD